MLNYEIEVAIELKLPIVACYVNYKKIQAPTKLASYWPSSLSKAIKNRTVKCIHIPFRKAPIFDAISQFTIHSDNILSSLSYYSSDAYKKFGII